MLHSEAKVAGADLGSPFRRSDRPRAGYKRTYDMKKMLLVGGLATLSWVSTYTGMLELVQANLGQLDLVFKIAIGGSVAMLMLMVVWLLDQLFNEQTSWSVRMLYIAGYLFLTLISVGFSFGFYWKFLESRSEASRTAESAVTQVQAAMHAAGTRLDQLQTTFAQLSTISIQKAEEENAKGNSCPNSKPGDGPRRRLREADAASFSTASEFVKQRSASIKTDIAALDTDLQKIVSQDKSTFDASGTRNEFMKALGRKLEITVAGFNAFKTDPQLKQFRADFAERADKTVFPDEQGKTFSCPDTQLQTVLKGTVKAIDALPTLDKPEIVTVEGADATIEAFRRLTVTLMSLGQLKLPPTPDEIRSQQSRAMQSLGAEKQVSEVEAGLGQRDYIPLAIALFVDLCLLLVSIPKPLSAAERTRRRRAMADGQIYRTLDDLYAIHDDPDARAKMEPLRHISFDYMGNDYVAVPLIASREGAGSEHDGSARNLTEEDMQEAQFIINFFASQEQSGPFRRAAFPPQAAVRARLKKLGSKWAGIQSFRIYRFRKGAWSDFVMDMVVGADHELTPVREKQLEARIKKNEMKSNEIVFESELKHIAHEATKTAKRKEAELNTMMIDTNISAQQHEAELRRREISAQSELSTLSLEASIATKRAEIERTRRDMARTLADDGGGESLRADARAEHGIRKPGFWDKIMGQREEAVAAEPSLDKRTRRSTPAPEPQMPSPDLAEMRQMVRDLTQSVSQLALSVTEMSRVQVSGTAAAMAAATTSYDSFTSQMPPMSAPANGYAAGSDLNVATSTAAAFDDLGTVRPLQPAGDGGPVNGSHSNGLRREPAFEPVPGGQRESRPAHEAPSVIVLPHLSVVRTEPELMTGREHHDDATSSAAPVAAPYSAPAPVAQDWDPQPFARAVRMPEPFRWAAESTMAGGVHAIEQPIEPLVMEATPITGELDEAVVPPYVAGEPFMAETVEVLPSLPASSDAEIEEFVADARGLPVRQDLERSVAPQWQREQAVTLGGEEFEQTMEADETESAAQDDFRIMEIAKKFGRGRRR